ncbi:MAG: arginine--tRNA ligase, partial [Deltaproteobacteria bacterium]|nr:arginine--tRNA ligase [Deltaproteobacteria bacterium]
PAAFARDAIGELERLYVRFSQEAGRDPALEDAARAETAGLQAGDPENRALWETFVRVSLAEFEAVYRRMGVRFDAVLGESFYQPLLQPLVDELKARGIAEDDQGAVVIRFDEADGKNLTPMLIRKSDGAALYATTDLAGLRYRERTWAPDRVVYVTDTRQQLHFRQLFAAARKAGLTGAELVHVAFGVLSLPEGSMSSRKGNVVRLMDLLDEAARRARVVVDDKSPHLDPAEREAIAEAVGVGAVRYADLSQNPQSDIVFEWDRMLSLDGNTAPFLLYALARCRSIQRKAGAPPGTVEGLRIGHPLERALALALLRFPEAVASALASTRPNLLCDHLFGLAQAFNRFYYELPVLRAEPQERVSRLAMVEATARVLGRGLEIVGIRPLERM